MRSVSPTMMHGVDALRGVFETFDRNGSGGIDLEELEAAFKVLGVPVSKAHAEKMLAEADLDGSGEIGFEEFCAVLDKGDGGHLAHLIHKTLADRGAREDVKERVRPVQHRPIQLEQQLAQVREERMWFQSLHMHTASEQAKAAKAGYVSDHSLFLGSNTTTPRGYSVSDPPSPTTPTKAADAALPSLARSVPNTAHELSPAPTFIAIEGKGLPSPRTSRRMLPDDASSGLDKESPSPTSSDGSPRTVVAGTSRLRRIFPRHAGGLMSPVSCPPPLPAFSRAANGAFANYADPSPRHGGAMRRDEAPGMVRARRSSLPTPRAKDLASSIFIASAEIGPSTPRDHRVATAASLQRPFSRR